MTIMVLDLVFMHCTQHCIPQVQQNKIIKALTETPLRVMEIYRAHSQILMTSVLRNETSGKWYLSQTSCGWLDWRVLCWKDHGCIGLDSVWPFYLHTVASLYKVDVS